MAIPFPDRPPEPPREARSLKKAVILAFLFGPLGLMYVSVPAGLFLLFTAFVVGLFTVGIGLLGVWAASVFLAVVLAWELEE
jgi:polyferredoxin